MGIKGFTKALAVVGFSAFSSIASADFIQTFRRQRLLWRVRPGLCELQDSGKYRSE